MTLTHSQVDEAMKPSRFDGHVTSLGDHHGIVVEPEKLSTSIKSQDKTYSSSASSLSSVFPGERIQFGEQYTQIRNPVHGLIIPSGSYYKN